MKNPDPRKHQIISMVKSAIRIVGCCISIWFLIAQPTNYNFFSLFMLVIFILFAELLGVYEELV